jgi:hypothetical protein
VRAAEAFDDTEVEIHPKGLIYLPHERLRNRLNEAFGAGWYRFLPVGEPLLGAMEVLWRYRLEFRDGTAAEAPGHAKYIKNNADYSYGDALETAKSDAFVRCCKDVGIGLQCWNRDYQIYFMQQYGVRMQSTKDNKWYWRRKDRPPIAYERQSRDQSEPDYVSRETLDQANRQHFDSLKPDPELPSNRVKPQQRPYNVDRDFIATRPPLDTQLRTGSREETTWEPETDEQLRRLHELEEAVFSDDAKGGD